LQSMNTDMVSSQGTAINDALKLSVDYFDIKDTSKLIILVSDGEDHGDGADEALGMAKDKDVRIFSIGMGTENGALIPIKDNRGNIISYKKDQNGDNVITKMYPETLKSISDKTKSK